MDAFTAAAAAAAGGSAAAPNTTAPSITTSPTSPPLPLDPASLFVLGVTVLVFFGPLLVLFPPWPPRTSDALAQTHSQPSCSSSSTSTTNKNKPQIASLTIQPIKSCAPIPLPHLKSLHHYHNLFTFAQLQSPFPLPSSSSSSPSTQEAQKKPTWAPITTRQFPRLASLQLELWQPDLAKILPQQRLQLASDASESFLLLRFPWHSSSHSGAAAWWWETLAAKCMRGWRAVPEMEVLVPVNHHQAEEEEEEAVEVPRELAMYLGVSNRLGLLRIGDVESKKSPSVNIVNLASGHSKDDAAADLSPPHPSIYITGLPADDEKTWKKIRFRPAPLKAKKTKQQQVTTTAITTPVFRVVSSPKEVELQVIGDEVRAEDVALEVGMELEVVERE